MAIVTARPDTVGPLSYAQRAVWAATRSDGSRGAHQWTERLPLHGTLHGDRIVEAVRVLARRHPALRSRFTLDDLHQVVDPEPAVTVDLHDVAAADPEACVEGLAVASAGTPFDLAGGPLFRAGLIRLAEDRHELVLTGHRIVCDPTSVRALVADLAKVYSHLVRGDDLPPPPARSPITSAREQRRRWNGQRGQARLRTWADELRGVASLDFGRRAVVDADGPNRSGHHHFSLGGELRDGLAALAASHGTSLFAVCLTGYAILLSRCCAATDFVVGVLTDGRAVQQDEDVVGCLANLVPVRFRLDNDPTVEELLAEARQTVLDVAGDSDLPLDLLADQLGLGGDSGRHRLVQATCQLIHASTTTVEFAGVKPVKRSPESLVGTDTEFDLALRFVDSGDKLFGTLGYSSELFDAGVIGRWADRLAVVLAEMVADPGRRVSRLVAMSAAERDEVVRVWNDTAVGFADGVTLVELFERQVDRSPDAVAVVFEDASVTFRGLDERANRVAWRLRGLGVGPGSLVGMCVERSMEMVVALLAVLKAGGAYVPLEPDYPVSRLADMVADCGAGVVLTQERLRDRLPSVSARLVDVDGDESRFGEWPGRRLGPVAGAGDLAYVIYTSGSTGRPKGVMVEHRAIVNRLRWMRRQFHFRPDDRFLQKTPYSFDVSVWELFCPLLVGATLVVAEPGGHMWPDYLADVIETERVTIVHFVPSMLRLFLAAPEVVEQCAGLRAIVCSGEALPAPLARTCRALIPAALHNLYGPTEAAVDVTAFDCGQDAWEDSVPIGRPIDNIRVYVLAAHLRPVPVGVVGDLHLAGVGLARGYLADPARTAEHFIADPFGPPGARMYRTGDVARWRADGQLEYLGRADRQVKLRGMRIEPGEIEAVMCGADGVHAAAVVLRNAGQGSAYLAGYYVADPELTEESLRERLKQELPRHMVPPALVRLDQMPLTRNGKLDVVALPAPVGRDVPTRRASGVSGPTR